jgi:hypothetical protein
MQKFEIKDIIFSAIKTDKIIWNQHALERMMQRGISRSMVLDCLKNHEIIETYSGVYPYPSFLLLGYSCKTPIHVVVSLNENQLEIYIITVYKPSLSKFYEDYKTRRKS